MVGKVLARDVTGNPGVFQGYPYSYPSQTVPCSKGMGFMWVQVRVLTGLAGTETHKGLEYGYTERPTHF